MFSMSLPLPRVRTWGVFSCRDYTPQLQEMVGVTGQTRAVGAGDTPLRSLVTCVRDDGTPLADEPSLIGVSPALLTARLARSRHSWVDGSTSRTATPRRTHS